MLPGYLITLMRSNQYEFKKWHQDNRFGNHPVEEMSWFEAIDYCRCLTTALKGNRKVSQQIQELFQMEFW